MAKGVRLRYSLEKGTLGAGLAAQSGSESITFSSVPGFGTITSGHYIPLILGGKEVVHLTSYTAGQTTGTIERGQDGTQPAAHDGGDSWIHGPTAVDLDELIDGRNGGREIIFTMTTVDATPTIDTTEGNVFDVTLTSNVEFSFDNVVASRAVTVTLVIRQDGAGGHAITWPASVKWDQGTSPSLTTDANSVSIVTLMTVDGGATWFGGVAGDAYA